MLKQRVNEAGGSPECISTYLGIGMACGATNASGFSHHQIQIFGLNLSQINGRSYNDVHLPMIQLVHVI